VKKLTSVVSSSASMCIYLAGPLFTQAEWQWNQRLKEELELRGVSVMLPQDRAQPMLAGEQSFNASALFKDNVNNIVKASAVVAIFDGADADSGTAWECGFAYRLGRPIIGVRTDIRAAGDDPKAAMNLMLSLSCNKIVTITGKDRTSVGNVADAIIDGLKGCLRQRKRRSTGSGRAGANSSR
jgi:nucleoside 2-deoxyribosyltransferase